MRRVSTVGKHKQQSYSKYCVCIVRARVDATARTRSRTARTDLAASVSDTRREKAYQYTHTMIWWAGGRAGGLKPEGRKEKWPKADARARSLKRRSVRSTKHAGFSLFAPHSIKSRGCDKYEHLIRGAQEEGKSTYLWFGHDGTG